LALLTCPISAGATDIDPFGTRAAVSPLASKNMLPSSQNQAPCQPISLSAPLELATVAELALCNHPQTRQAWANVKAQAAQVGIAKSAYLPAATLTGVKTTGSYDSTVTNYPQLDYQIHSASHDVAINLSWTLFDFGARQASLESANQLLMAANATQDATLQTVFANATQAYYDAQSANGALHASLDAEQTAKESFEAAEAKYKAGVGALADKLQAQTNYVQARLNRVKAEGDVKNAQGTLANAMGLPANTEFTLAPISTVLPGTEFIESIDKLIELAKHQHPSLLSAQAQVNAATADVAAAKADGLPVLSLVGNVDRNKQPGQYSIDTTTGTNTIGVQLKIPLFDGVAHSYRVQAAKAKLESKLADLANTEQQIALDVWKNYQTLATETDNLTNSKELVDSATQSFNVARGRYKSGVGNIIELLNAETALANAQQQNSLFLSNWCTARIKLAASLGQLGMWAAK
jgi:outer membrane protein